MNFHLNLVNSIVPLMDMIPSSCTFQKKTYGTASVYLSLLQLVDILLGSQGSTYKVIATKDRILYGHSFLNITGLAMDKCLAKCLQECQCLSFQICEDDQLCQLCSVRHEQNDLKYFRKRKGCTSFIFHREQSQKTSHEKSCVPDPNCCLTSTPCQNGATCVFNPKTSLPEARFSCKCRPGYNGDYCEEPIRSCSGYIHSNNGNGVYEIIDKTTITAFPVACIFWSNSSRSTHTAWTLIQSYRSTDKKIIEQASKNGTSIKEDSPNLRPYRLAVSKMKSIRENSTRWRISHNKNKCSTRVYAKILAQGCESCYHASTRQKMDANTTLKSQISCNIETGESLHSSNDHMGRTDEFGLFCCITYPRNCSDSVSTRIWLGDVIEN